MKKNKTKEDKSKITLADLSLQVKSKESLSIVKDFEIINTKESPSKNKKILKQVQDKNNKKIENE